jgi:hypothetical protein
MGPLFSGTIHPSIKKANLSASNIGADNIKNINATDLSKSTLNSLEGKASVSENKWGYLAIISCVGGLYGKASFGSNLILVLKVI